MKKSISIGLLAATSLLAHAEITPEDGQKFEPYAITAGLLDALSDACLPADSRQKEEVFAASVRLQSTLTRYGMPQEAYTDDFKKGQSQGRQAAVTAGHTQDLCTEKVGEVLRSWPQAVAGVVSHLNQVANN